jgi:hypothetical protein
MDVWLQSVVCNGVVCVATLALGSRPRQGLVKVRAKREAMSVGECENKHSHSQMNSHVGSWSPGGLPKFQRVISKGQTPHLEELFISLEIY